MAPEQATFNALDVDTRADIYALGVILYELLTGSTPIERVRLKQAGVRRDPAPGPRKRPPVPSKRSAPPPRSRASRPIGNSSRPARPIPCGASLDWIVMKALAKEPRRRYESASGFAEGHGDCLTQRAGASRAARRGHKLRKFVRRNRPKVMAAVVVLLRDSSRG